MLLGACLTVDSYVFTAADAAVPTSVDTCDLTVSIMHTDGVTVVSSTTTTEANNDGCCSYAITNQDAVLSAACTNTLTYTFDAAALACTVTTVASHATDLTSWTVSSDVSAV